MTMPPPPIMFCGHHRRIARNMRTEITRDQPRIAVVGAADIDADQKIDGLAAMESATDCAGAEPGKQHAGQNAN
jgi:hypothetical protein